MSWVTTLFLAAFVAYVGIVTHSLYELWTVPTCVREPCLHPAALQDEEFLVEVLVFVPHLPKIRASTAKKLSAPESPEDVIFSARLRLSDTVVQCVATLRSNIRMANVSIPVSLFKKSKTLYGHVLVKSTRMPCIAF